MRCGTRTTSAPGGVKERAVRYNKEHKQAARQHVIEAAGRRFKTDGIDGSGIAALMADVGADRRRLLRPFRLQGRSGRRDGRPPTAHTMRKRFRAAARPCRRGAVAYRQNWGEDRVHLHDENGQLFSS
jgi:hypothetical protein